MLKINESFYRLQGKDSFVQKNHTHNEIELIHVVHGNGMVLKNDKTYPLKSQHIYVIDARNAHIVYPQPEDCKDYIRNKIVIGADSFVAFCQENQIGEIPMLLFNAAPISTVEHPEVDRLYQKIEVLCATGKSEDMGFAQGYIIELLHWIYSRCVDKKPMEQNDTVQDSTIQKVLNIIAGKEGLTSLQEISEILHMDKYYLCHMFKEKTGRGLSDYLADKIYEKCCKLLQNTSYSIEEIAFQCGFSSASSLIRFFKNKSGQTPAKFRRENCMEHTQSS